MKNSNINIYYYDIAGIIPMFFCIKIDIQMDFEYQNLKISN